MPGDAGSGPGARAVLTSGDVCADPSLASREPLRTSRALTRHQTIQAAVAASAAASQAIAVRPLEPTSHVWMLLETPLTKSSGRDQRVPVFAPESAKAQ